MATSKLSGKLYYTSTGFRLRIWSQIPTVKEQEAVKAKLLMMTYLCQVVTAQIIQGTYTDFIRFPDRQLLTKQK